MTCMAKKIETNIIILEIKVVDGYKFCYNFSCKFFFKRILKICNFWMHKNKLCNKKIP